MFSQHARWVGAYRIIANKIKIKLVTRKKNCIAVLRRLSSIAHCTAIGLTFKTGTAGGQRVGGDHGAVVFFRLGCVVWFVVLGGIRCWFFVTLWLESHGFEKIYVRRVWYDWLDSPFFSSEIIYTYVGCGINIRRWQKMVKDKKRYGYIVAM